MARTKETEDRRGKKRKTAPAAQRSFDPHRFYSVLHADRFKVIQKEKKYWTERKVDLKPGEYEEIRGEIARRGWERLVSYPDSFNITLVQEFYANAMEFEDEEQPWISYVRGTRVPYDAHRLNTFLGTDIGGSDECCYRRNTHEGMTLSDLESVMCIPGRRFRRNRSNAPLQVPRKNLNKIAQAWMTIVLCNFMPSSHTSDIEMHRAILIYTIMKGQPIDIGRIISNEIRHISKTTDRTLLGYPSLITELCRHGGVDPDTILGAQEKLRGPITKTYIDRYCIEPGQIPEENVQEDVPSFDHADAERAGPSHVGLDAVTREEFMHLSRKTDQIQDDVHEILEILRNQRLDPVAPRDESSSSEEEDA